MSKPVIYKPPKKPRERGITARGKFYSTQDLIENVNQLAHQGVGMMRIAELCGIHYATVKRILFLDPREEKALVVPDYTACYVLVTERGVPTNVDRRSLELHPQLDKTWIHGSAVEDSDVLSIRRKIDQIGDSYGRVRVAKLVFVETDTLREPGDSK